MPVWNVRKQLTIVIIVVTCNAVRPHMSVSLNLNGGPTTVHDCSRTLRRRRHINFDVSAGERYAHATELRLWRYSAPLQVRELVAVPS
jgi:hypothetical protein